jgi:Tol biopolymer transport system component
MALTPGTRLGPYEITVQVGAGGMGEVYRARDTKLGREIAIKVLPAALTNDADRLARFAREAHLLAALNHPNIASIYHVQESPEGPALVMELVDGETLADRLARSPLPIDEALPIARQIAEALEAAHEQGIIHRDLKPANIKVRPDGMVKVLDFGLAKLAEPGSENREPKAGGARPGASLSPTITSPALMTGVGILLGTAAYMSPEQAKGKPADKRSDIWAFGCVLYEMLTGKRAFAGDDVSETLASVLAREPDWTTLPATVAPPIRTLLRLCLDKDRRTRVADISTARFAIDEARALKTTPSTDEAAVQPRINAAVATALAQVRRGMRVRLALTGAIAAIVVGASVGGALWFATRPTPPRVVQLAIPTAPATALTIDGVDRHLAITPDGSRIVYVGNNGTELFVRSLDALEPVSLYKGGVLRGPFVSPDGQWVGFIDVTTLKKVAITGGPAVAVAPLDRPIASVGAVWMPDDTIVFATVGGAGGPGLQQVTAGGGPVKVLTRPNRARGEGAHLWPEMLPGGRAVIFTIMAAPPAAPGDLDAAQIAVLDLQTQTQTVVVRGGSHAHYVASGHLVYAAGGTLRAIAFDPVTVTTRGTPVPVVADVAGIGAVGVEAVVANDGTLAYVRGAGPGTLQRTLIWVDRQGRETAVAAPPRAYVYPRISPDGARVVVYAADQMLDLWVWDIARLTLTRSPFMPDLDTYPVWTPDGRRLLFSSAREGPRRNLYAQAADGTGAAERLTTSPNQQDATAITPDGTRLLFTETPTPTGVGDVMQVAVTGTHTVTPLVRTPAAERNAIVSPDGRWLAYEANDSGTFEIYVRPYPDVTSGRWQVSTAGGTRPLWSRDGRELFYVSPANALMRVGVERAASWAATTPAMLLKDGLIFTPAVSPGRSYDVSPDGQRFLVLKPANVSNAPPPPQLVIVQHFDEMLKRLVPRK